VTVRKTAATVTVTAADPRGFVDVYRRTVADVYSYLASRVGDRQTAEELTQDVFVVGARRAAAGEVVDVPWLIGVARHKLIDHWRAEARRERNLALAHSMEQLRSAEEWAVVDPGLAARVLACLSLTYREALVLRHVDGLSVAAVAGYLGRTVEATDQVLSRARATFRAKYRELADE
jgi:RNA polymerase sigma-70 factor (ECF subfamily)